MEDLGTRILGLALARGLITVPQVQEAVDFPEGILAWLRTRSPLTGEDLTLLEHLAEEGTLIERLDSETSTQIGALELGESGPAGHIWDSQPQADSRPGAPGRRVLRVLALPAWKQYRNLRFVAEGGMGRVFKAYDPTLNRVVALKFLRQEHPELLARFVMEAQHQAQVEHPYVCRVYEVGDWQGQSFIAMQFVKGQTLDHAIPELSLESKVLVMERAAEAIHAAHRVGLIHRDIKPANIMVALTERGPEPTILDFGLARAMEAPGITQQGLVVGTVHYMAPEQARGELDKIHRRTDIYGLGATLHKVLTGDPPFAEVEGLEAIRRAVDHEVPSLRRLVPDLPEDLDTIVRKCLEKDPAQRYESALALAEDLRRWREGEPILARKPTWGYRTATWARRHRLLVGIGAAALLALLGTGSYAAWISWTAAARAQHAQGFGQEAERIEALLRYAHLAPYHDIRPELRQARRRLQDLEGRARRAGALAAGPADYAMGRSHLALGDPGRARPLLERAWSSGLRTPEVALALGRAYGQIFRVELDRARALPSRELRQAGQRRAEQTLRDPALAYLRQGAPAALEASAFHEAQVAFYGGQWKEAQAHVLTAREETPWLYETHRLEGQILLERARLEGEPTAAVRQLEAAAEVFRKVQALAPSDPKACLEEAEAWTLAASRGLEAGLDPAPFITRCRAAVRMAQDLDPERPDGPALMARATGLGAQYTLAPLEVRQALTEEQQAWSMEAMRLAPDARESLLARGGALLRAARRAWNEDRPPDELQEQALAILLRGQSLHPQDPAFLVLLRDYHYGRFLAESYGGRPPWQSFEGLLSTAAALLERFPDLPESYERVAAAWIERGEYERRHGLDPCSSIEQALHYVAFAETRGLTGGSLFGARANALLIRGQHLTRTSGAGKGDLNEAIAAYRAAFQRNRNRDTDLISAAEAAAWIAEEHLEAGESPESALSLARTLLDENAQGRSEYYYRPCVEGLLDLRAGQWQLLQRLDPTAVWNAAERNLKHALALRGQTPSGLALAELYARRFLHWNRPRDREEALRMVARVLAWDPRNAEAHLWMAVVESASAQGPSAGMARQRAAEARDRALALDRNLTRTARGLGLGP